MFLRGFPELKLSQNGFYEDLRGTHGEAMAEGPAGIRSLHDTCFSMGSYLESWTGHVGYLAGIRVSRLDRLTLGLPMWIFLSPDSC